MNDHILLCEANAVEEGENGDKVRILLLFSILL